MSELLPLRHRVLRAGLPAESAVFYGDSEPTTRHFVAETDGQIIACATLMLREWERQPAWQLRGMATDPRFQGSGVGSRLLRFVENWAREQSSIHLLWCNARTPAVGFYQRHGWTVASDEFDIPTAGPHYRMCKPLAK